MTYILAFLTFQMQSFLGNRKRRMTHIPRSSWDVWPPWAELFMLGNWRWCQTQEYIRGSWAIPGIRFFRK
eukprot:8801812-Pyramimonas_sp.AAC.1